jgi:hypothetical protein
MQMIAWKSPSLDNASVISSQNPHESFTIPRCLDFLPWALEHILI